MLKLFLTFFKIGLFTFGGGYAMIPLIHKEAIEKHGWLSEEEFLDIIAIAESTPGPIAINSATYIGYLQGKTFGAFIATLGVALPSFIIITLISMFLITFKENQIVEYAFQGIRVGVSLLILNAAYKLFKKLKLNLFSVILLITGFILMLFKLIPTLLIIAIGGICGIIYTLISVSIEVRK